MLRTSHNVYLVYEYCNGGTLEELLKKRKVLSEREALSIFQQIINAFRVLFKENILHRDLKPSNILFHDGVIKIADFGFCKSMLHANDMAKTMVGSPIYMAPEVLKGQKYNTKADIWSLGVVLFEMLFGFCPFEDKTIARLIQQIDTKPFTIPKNKNPISKRMEELITKMIVVDYKKRIDGNQLINFPLFLEALPLQPTNTATAATTTVTPASQQQQIKNVQQQQIQGAPAGTQGQQVLPNATAVTTGNTANAATFQPPQISLIKNISLQDKMPSPQQIPTSQTQQKIILQPHGNPVQFFTQQVSVQLYDQPTQVQPQPVMLQQQMIKGQLVQAIQIVPQHPCGQLIQQFQQPVQPQVQVQQGCTQQIEVQFQQITTTTPQTLQQQEQVQSASIAQVQQTDQSIDQPKQMTATTDKQTVDSISPKNQQTTRQSVSFQAQQQYKEQQKNCQQPHEGDQQIPQLDSNLYSSSEEQIQKVLNTRQSGNLNHSKASLLQMKDSQQRTSMHQSVPSTPIQMTGSQQIIIMSQSGCQQNPKSQIQQQQQQPQHSQVDEAAQNLQQTTASSQSPTLPQQRQQLFERQTSQVIFQYDANNTVGVRRKITQDSTSSQQQPLQQGFFTQINRTCSIQNLQTAQQNAQQQSQAVAETNNGKAIISVNRSSGYLNGGCAVLNNSTNLTNQGKNCSIVNDEKLLAKQNQQMPVAQQKQVLSQQWREQQIQQSDAQLKQFIKERNKILQLLQILYQLMEQQDEQINSSNGNGGCTSIASLPTTTSLDSKLPLSSVTNTSELQPKICFMVMKSIWILTKNLQEGLEVRSAETQVALQSQQLQQENIQVLAAQGVQHEILSAEMEQIKACLQCFKQEIGEINNAALHDHSLSVEMNTPFLDKQYFRDLLLTLFHLNFSEESTVFRALEEIEKARRMRLLNSLIDFILMDESSLQQEQQELFMQNEIMQKNTEGNSSCNTNCNNAMRKILSLKMNFIKVKAF